MHVVLFCEDARVGRLARAIVLALRALASTGVEPAHVRPVRDRGHLEWLVAYLLGQPAHHGLGEHPAITTGSCWPDLVGARRAPGLTLPLLRALPRFRLRDATRHVRLPPIDLTPAPDEVIRAAGAARLACTVAAAHAVGPALRGNTPSVVEARAAVVQLGAAAGIHVAELAHALGAAPDAARKMGARPPDPALHRAARLALTLDALAHAPGPDAPLHPGAAAP